MNILESNELANMVCFDKSIRIDLLVYKLFLPIVAVSGGDTGSTKLTPPLTGHIRNNLTRMSSGNQFHLTSQFWPIYLKCLFL